MLDMACRLSHTALLLLCLLLTGCSSSDSAPIRVGILHAQSGPLAASEQPVANSTLLAIEEINASGGLLGRQVQPILGENLSDPDSFAREAQRLIVDEQVEVLFGCWTSASRKAVLPVLKGHRHLLFYPLQYEGLEKSPYVVYTGAVPNQQMVPGIKWALDHLGSRFFLVGSDYIYPHTANFLAQIQLQVLGAEVVGTEYLALGEHDVEHVLQMIKETKPDVLLNTVNGDTNVALFAGLKKAGLKIPTMSLSLGEHDARFLDLDPTVEHYAAWNYFQSVDTPENHHFIREYRKMFGTDALLSDPMEAAYFGVHLWAQAVRDAGSSTPASVRSTIGGQSYAAPEGLVSVDDSTLHTWKTVRVGRLQGSGQFEIVWSSQGPVRPRPFPFYRTVGEWEEYLRDYSETRN